MLTDAQGVACIDQPAVGAMGVHYVKADLVGDAAVDASTPEAGNPRVSCHPDCRAAARRALRE